MTIPIRARIIFLAFISLVFLLLAIISEYTHVRDNVLASEKSLRVIEEVSDISQLIHSLQKERGLTSINLFSHNKEIYSKLLSQRAITDAELRNSPNSSILFFKAQESLTGLIDRIKTTRETIDNDKASWKVAKEFYNLEINRLLFIISTQLSELEYAKEISHQLYAAICLLSARENLGILRASVLQYYKKETPQKDELLDISYKYGVFIDKFNYFKSHIKKTPCSALKKSLEEEFLTSAKTQIVHIIKEQKPLPSTSSDAWWREVTSIIDSMKEVENTLFTQIKKSSQEIITTNEKHFLWYIVSAFIALVLITALTASTVIRILRALSTLMNSLSQVEKTQNFTLRLSTKSKDEFGQLSFSINSLLDYTDQILKEKDELASIDILTGVMNRRSYIKLAELEIERSSRYENSLSVIFCDIDNFKYINDTYGHNVGDDVLKYFANALSLNIRKFDLLVRWGGEEFIVMATQTDQSQAHELAESLRKIVMHLSIPKVDSITCSFGIAQMQKGESLDELHKRADEAMFRAKKLGRNRVCIASDSA